jgi:RimJ/RimL family protein N-acetyltransferase
MRNIIISLYEMFVAKRSSVPRLLYYRDRCDGEFPELDDSRVKVWRPAPFRFFPRGLTMDKWPYFIYMWIVHYDDIIRGNGYTFFLIYDGKRLAHYTGVAKKSLKYPFMHDDDLVVGPCLTYGEYQGMGFAYLAMVCALRHFITDVGKMWFVVRADNVPSRSLVEKCGFESRQAKSCTRFGLNVYK